jgi:hypothetical protein
MAIRKDHTGARKRQSYQAVKNRNTLNAGFFGYSSNSARVKRFFGCKIHKIMFLMPLIIKIRCLERTPVDLSRRENSRRCKRQACIE